uniref:C-JID domain-containing protein n=1 Tax=Rhizophora mucronata TaxID=61149 RepID=A0A2P2NKF0_RHIMU
MKPWDGNHGHYEFVPPYVQICYPGNRVPEWFMYQSMGSSVRIQLPSDWLESFRGFVLCVVLEDSFSLPLRLIHHLGYICDDKNKHPTPPPFELYAEGIERFSFRTEHVIIWNSGTLDYVLDYLQHLQCPCDASIFNFGPGSKVRKCGVTPL